MSIVASEPTACASLKAAQVLLALLHLRGVGRKTAYRLLSGREPPNALEELVARLPGKPIGRVEMQRASEYADSILERSAKEHVRVVTMFDSEYPRRLKDIDDPPIVLHVKGDLATLNLPSAIAVIGTREPTSYGRGSARRIAAGIARAGTVVISGLARGCDAEAHWGCLEANGQTISVLAHGLDKVYPAENRPLAKEILAKSGCLVSEYEIGKPAFRTAFIERDRLQSGLSQAVIVIETGLTGGSLHTVRFARQQGRIVACLKHPDSLNSEEKTLGNAKLIQDGTAIPLSSAEDLQALMAGLSASVSPPELQGSEETMPVPPRQLSIF